MRSSSDHRKNEGALRACLLALTLVAGGGASNDALNAVQARYDGVRDMRAEFVQSSFTAALGRASEARGSVLVERPGKMRWSYSDGRVIALNGKTIKIYDPEDHQLQIAALAEGTVSPTALSFLMGDGVLREIFDATLIPDETRPEIGLRLTPRSDGSFEKLELWVDAKTHQMRESTVIDLFGNRTTLRFEKMLENQGTKPAEFDVEVPEGTQVIDLR